LLRFAGNSKASMVIRFCTGMPCVCVGYSKPYRWQWQLLKVKKKRQRAILFEDHKYNECFCKRLVQ
jgi:hypothetical protein